MVSGAKARGQELVTNRLILLGSIKFGGKQKKKKAVTGRGLGSKGHCNSLHQKKPAAAITVDKKAVSVNFKWKQT